MGRAYANELAELDETYAWAVRAEFPELERAVSRAAHLPLVAVGPGGSLTTANVMMQLHRRFAGCLALTTSPLQLETSIPEGGLATVWLISAGGRNKDIRAALRSATEREPRQLAILCGAPASPLMRDAATRPWVDRLAAALPSADGFLATNSALALSVLLARSYLALDGSRVTYRDLSALLAEVHPEYRALEERCAPLWRRGTTIILHGSSTAPAALDLESRFTEAALGVAQLADFRNFAHGRHHWLAKHAETSSILALVGPEDKALARDTLRILPPEVPAVALHFSGLLPDVLLGSIVTTMRLAAAAGSVRRIDPGRPGVPDFGRRLYQMKIPRRSSPLGGSELPPPAEAAIVRKARTTIADLRARGAIDGWLSALAEARARLAQTTFGAVVCDYDGTLVESFHRERPPEANVVEGLTRLLSAGIVVGIATGRGDSVTTSLRDVLPKKNWSAVIVGYHNGAIIQPLNEDPVFPRREPCGSLARAADALEKEKLLQGIAQVRVAADQITVSPRPRTSEEDLWLLVADTVRRENLGDLRVVRSSHTVDVLPATSSKLAVVQAAQQLSSSGKATLALGDRGCWPGNDYELLSSPYALSVDEISPDPNGAWNLCPSGHRGVSGIVFYFNLMEVNKGFFRLILKGDAS